MGWMAQNWLADKTWAMVSIIVVSVWKNMGMLVIMFMAGLQAIPNDIIEASKIDGASTMQRIFKVIIPNLKESFVICGIWAIIQSVKVFEQPFIMTNGGPGDATMVLYQYTWMNAFKYMELGYASSIAYFMGVIILVLSYFNMRANRSDEEKEIEERKKEARRQARLEKKMARKEGNA
jgi:ABC-type sugar transport system permease subunit